MMVRWLLPRAVLSALFAGGAVFTLFESLYLRDQSSELAASHIEAWMWAFRAIALLMSVLTVVIFVKR